MSGKDIIMDFVSYLFLIALLLFFIFYVIIGNRLGMMVALMSNLVPIGVFGSVFVVMIMMRKNEVKKRRKYGDTEINLSISLTEKFIIDFLIGLVPVAMLVVGLMMNGDINFSDILQAMIVLSAMSSIRFIIYRSSR